MMIPINYPYAYLYSKSGIYDMLSVVVQAASGKAITVKDASGLDAGVDRVLWLAGTTAGSGMLYQKDFDIKKVPGKKIDQVHTKISEGTTVRTCILYPEDYPVTDPVPADLRYRPHLYLTHFADKPTEYELHALVYQEAKFTYKTKLTLGTPNRVEIIEEKRDGAPAGFVPVIVKYTDINSANWVEVDVKVGSTVVAKGKVRHSVADNKPFF